MQTIAAIDAGSNAIRLLIGKVNEAGRVEALENLRVPIRLGKDAFRDGCLGEASIQETVNAFATFRKVIHDYGVSHYRAVSTSALREASNRDVLTGRIREACGIELEVISGAEEARLIHLAVSRVVDLRKTAALLVDIGGGSIEVTLSVDGNILSAESFKAGAVRLLGQLDAPDSPGGPVEQLVRGYVESPRRRIRQLLQSQKISLLVGTGGNAEELGELARKILKRKSDRVLRLKDLQALIARLENLPYEERIRQLGLRPDRADVILPAAIVFEVIAAETRQHEIVIPHVSLKEGVLWELADEAAHGARPSRTEQVWVSVRRLGRKYGMDESHAGHVAALAGSIFDQTRSLHRLEPDDRLLLEAAAYLHDVGHFISTIDHDRHGAYILGANSIIGLTEEQQTMVAGMIRFHRRQPPGLDDPAYRALSQRARQVVVKLLSILRIADGLDTNRSGRVWGVVLTEEKAAWKMVLHGGSDLLLEKWTADKRKGLFCETFGVTLELEV